jgi:hypothetical protein
MRRRIATWLGCVVLVLAQRGCNSNVYTAPPAELFVIDMEPADVNNDNHPDIVSVIDDLRSSVNVRVDVNRGDDTFDTKPLIPVPNAVPIDSVIGDLNHDGKIDVVVAQNDPKGGGTVSMLPGNGDGTFGALQPLVAVDTAIVSVAIWTSTLTLLVGVQDGVVVAKQVADGTYSAGAKVPLPGTVAAKPLEDGSGRQVIAAVSSDGTQNALALAHTDGSGGFDTSLGLKWTPLSYSAPFGQSHQTTTLQDQQGHAVFGWLSTPADTSMFQVNMVGIDLSVNTGYSITNQSSGQHPAAGQPSYFFSLGYTLKGTFYSSYHYFVGGSPTAPVTGNVAFGAEYFFYDSFSLGAETLNVAVLSAALVDGTPPTTFFLPGAGPIVWGTLYPTGFEDAGVGSSGSSSGGDAGGDASDASSGGGSDSSDGPTCKCLWGPTGAGCTCTSAAQCCSGFDTCGQANPFAQGLSNYCCNTAGSPCSPTQSTTGSCCGGLQCVGAGSGTGTCTCVTSGGFCVTSADCCAGLGCSNTGSGGSCG